MQSALPWGRVPLKCHPHGTDSENPASLSWISTRSIGDGYRQNRKQWSFRWPFIRDVPRAQRCPETTDEGVCDNRARCDFSGDYDLVEQYQANLRQHPSRQKQTNFLWCYHQDSGLCLCNQYHKILMFLYRSVPKICGVALLKFINL